MTIRRESKVDEIRAQAAYWFTRINSGEASEQELSEFRKWHSETPENAQSYQYIRYFCDADYLPSEPIPTIEPSNQESSEPERNRFWYWLSGGLLFLLGMMIMLYILQSNSQPWHAESAKTLLSNDTRVEYNLADGAYSILNRGTNMRYDEKQRHVYLDQGQAYFDVQAEVNDPITIFAGESEIRALGTSLDVLKEGSRVRITVESGHAEVSAGSWWRKRVRLLVPGQSIEVDDWLGMQKVVVVPLAERFAWVKGKFLFVNTPLSEVVKELNRYRSQSLSLSPEAGLAQLLFSGEFSLDEPDTVLEAMFEYLPIKLGLEQQGMLQLDERKQLIGIADMLVLTLTIA